jgi:hypothetical protein
MIDRELDLPPGRRAGLLTLRRISMYYEPQLAPPGEFLILQQV